MVAEAGNTYISETMTDSVKIPTANSTFSTTTSTSQIKQESLADAKLSARQQCVYEDP